MRKSTLKLLTFISIVVRTEEEIQEMMETTQAVYSVDKLPVLWRDIKR